MGLGGGGGERGDVRVVQDHRAGAGEAEGLLALAGAQDGHVRRAADGQDAVGVQGHAGEVPAHDLDVPEGLEGEGGRFRRAREAGGAPRQGGIRSGEGRIAGTGGGSGDRQGGQQIHEQIRGHAVEGGGQQGQEGAAIGYGLAAAGEEVREEFLHAGDLAIGKLGLEIGEAGELAAGEKLDGLVHGDAALHGGQQLPEAVQGGGGVQLFGLASAGDHRAQVQGGQIAHGGAAIRGLARDGGHDVRAAGVFVQAQSGQNGLRREGGPGEALEEPAGDALRISPGERAGEEEGAAAGGAFRHAVQVAQQVLQFLLEGGAVLLAAAGGLFRQLRQTAQALLDLGEDGFAGLEGPAALPGEGLRPEGAGHPLLHRVRGGGGRGLPGALGGGSGGLLLRLHRPLLPENGGFLPSSYGQFVHSWGLPSVKPPERVLCLLILTYRQGGRER